MVFGVVSDVAYGTNRMARRLPATPWLATFQLSLRDEWIIAIQAKIIALGWNMRRTALRPDVCYRARSTFKMLCRTHLEGRVPGGLPMCETAGYQPALQIVEAQ
jgi:hypothetical protein